MLSFKGDKEEGEVGTVKQSWVVMEIGLEVLSQETLSNKQNLYTTKCAVSASNTRFLAS